MACGTHAKLVRDRILQPDVADNSIDWVGWEKKEGNSP
jgi:hypothetical protein